MQTSTEFMPESIFRINYTFEHDELYPEIKRLLSSIRMPGFRPGRVTMAVADTVYGKNAVYHEVASKKIGNGYQKILEENSIKYIGNGMFNMEPYDKNQPYVFHYDFYYEGKPEIGEYKGFKLVVPKTEVTDEMMENQIQTELRKQTSRTAVTDRPCKSGDQVNVSYEGTIDGVAFEGGKSESSTFVLGEGRNLADLDNGIVGMTVNEERDVPVHFPEDYHGESVRGKDAVFHVKLNSITEISVPELDDDFVQDVSEFDTVEAYRANIRKDLEEKCAEQDKSARNERILREIMKTSDFTVPLPYLQNQVNAMIQDQAAQYARFGLKYEDFLKANNMTIDSVAQSLMPSALRTLREYFVARELIERENITADDADLKAYLVRGIAEDRVDEYMGSLSETEKEEFMNSCKLDKLYDIIAETCEFTYVAPGDPALRDEPAAEAKTEAAAAEETTETTEAGKE
ncbi:MAG: trigger factor [Clostridia bacterium]|nr:trigger factor [Clostridia bacterium]